MDTTIVYISIHTRQKTMRFFCLATLVAAAAAFAPQPKIFKSGPAVDQQFDRQSVVVHDGKANGELLLTRAV